MSPQVLSQPPRRRGRGARGQRSQGVRGKHLRWEESDEDAAELLDRVVDRALKSFGLIAQAGGFGVVALDFAVASDPLVSAAHRRETAMSILSGMGLASKANASATTLSQVELRKMELARAMATRPKLLISDEAMAGLSSSEVDEVLDLLMSLAGHDITVIMIEHIMQAVMRFSERVMCLDAGKIIAIGKPSEVMANQRVQEAYLGT